MDSAKPLPDSLDVLIVGAGPTGMTLALELSRHGVESLALVDKNELSLAYKAKGLTIFPRTLEIYESLGVEIPEMHPLSLFDYVNEDNVVYKTLDVNSIYKVSKFPHIYQNPQSVTELKLKEALDKKGIEIKRLIEVVSFEEMGDHTKITYKFQDQEYETKVKYVAACDGARSIFRKSLKIDYKGETRENTTFVTVFETDSKFNKEALVLGFYKQTSWAGLPVNSNTFGFYCELTEEESKKFLSETEKDRNGLKKPVPIPNDKMEEYMNKRGVKLNVIKPVWVTHFRVNNRYAESYWNGKNIFLVGDAAHSSDPILGLGLNIGCQDAQNLGWKLGMIIKGLVTSKILGTYAHERLHDGKVLLMDLLKRTYDTALMKDNVRQKVIPIVSSAPLKYFVHFDEQILETGRIKQRYQNEFIVDNSIYKFGSFFKDALLLKHKAGDFFLSMTLNEVDPDFLIRTTGFKIVAFTIEVEQKEKEILKVASHYPFVTDVRVTKWSESYKKYGFMGPCLVVLRPDSHSCLVDSSFNYAMVKRILDKHQN